MKQSLNKNTFLKSFATVKSPEFADSLPVNVVFNITKKPPNSSIAFAPCPPLISIMQSNSAPDNEPPEQN